MSESLTLSLPEEVAAEIARQAQARGVSTAEYVAMAARKMAAADSANSAYLNARATGTAWRKVFGVDRPGGETPRDGDELPRGLRGTVRASFAAASLAALAGALIASAPASAKDNPITCGRFERAVARAGSAAELQDVMRVASSHKDCPTSHAQTERKRVSFQDPPPSPPVVSPAPPPQQPAIVRSPPAPSPRDIEADVFAAADTCAEMREYQSLYRNGRFRAQAQAFLNSETCNPRLSPPAPVRVSPPPPPPPAPTLADGQTFRDCVDCPEMVVIPAGSFMMGSPAGETGGRTDESPQRTVNISRFAAGKFEVSFDEWAACVAGGGCRSNANPGDQGWGRGRRPVINVSWNDAEEYVQWLSQKTSQRYDLLTEAEWEYAARAGTKGRFSNNGAEQQLCQIANHADQSTSYDWKNTACSDGVDEQTTTVGRYAPNDFGLYDVHGNVWEWVQDCYQYSYGSFGPRDPVNDPSTCNSSRVLRGGSWSSAPQVLRSAFRISTSPSDRFSLIGFRLARTVSPPAP